MPWIIKTLLSISILKASFSVVFFIGIVWSHHWWCNIYVSLFNCSQNCKRRRTRGPALSAHVNSEPLNSSRNICPATIPRLSRVEAGASGVDHENIQKATGNGSASLLKPNWNIWSQRPRRSITVISVIRSFHGSTVYSAIWWCIPVRRTSRVMFAIRHLPISTTARDTCAGIKRGESSLGHFLR